MRRLIMIKRKRLLSIMFTLSLVIGLFAAVPITASAEDYVTNIDEKGGSKQESNVIVISDATYL
jgi:hypothetical protein